MKLPTAFCFPVYTWTIVLSICSVKALCASVICSYPSQSFLDKLPPALASGKERRRKASRLRIPADLHGNSDLLPVQYFSILWLCESIYLQHAVNLLLRKWKWVLDNHFEQLGAALVVTEIKLWKKFSQYGALRCTNGPIGHTMELLAISARIFFSNSEWRLLWIW